MMDVLIQPLNCFRKGTSTNRHKLFSLLIYGFLQACMNGHLEAVEFLCEFGASLSRKDAHGDTAVRHAAAFGHLHILQFLTQVRLLSFQFPLPHF